MRFCSLLVFETVSVIILFLAMQAGVAKLETSLSFVGDKLELKLYGFNDKLPILLSKILKLSKTFMPNIDRFKVHSPRTGQLADGYIPPGLCHGNLSEEEAINISNIFTNTFPVEPIPAGLRHKERVICLPSGCSLNRSVSVKNELEVNSVVEKFYVFHADHRTKEQLGYVVESGPRMTYRVLGYCFRIQSSKYGPLYLHDRINNFINGLQDLLDCLDDESFESHRSGLIAEKLEKDPSLTYETGHYWSQIVEKRSFRLSLAPILLFR
ncbi:hypothetical protein BHE74_00022453 [Ensete ventricosum]|nr:hypothetical protein GW17_00026043 [Ensete ventricosum]RWW69905.1 hypothetical protein BHE74_00022453 [Ensete ventricosum]